MNRALLSPTRDRDRLSTSGMFRQRADSRPARSVRPRVSIPVAAEAPRDTAPRVQCLVELRMAVNSPTACVTNRSPRSLSGASSRAGTRTIRGCPGKIYSIGDDGGGGVGGCGARSASTVTASAMPREKLRPRQPLVAMPRTGCAEFHVVVSEKRRTIRPLHHADHKVLAGGQMQRNVAAVVHIGARRVPRP